MKPEPAAKQQSNYSAGGKMAEVRLSALNTHYNDGDVVDMSSLKAKRLIPGDSVRVKIIATGKLNKRLTVKADRFTTQAKTAISAAGGKAIELPHRKEGGQSR